METKGARLLSGKMLMPQKRRDANASVDSRDVILETPGQFTQTGFFARWVDEMRHWNLPSWWHRRPFTFSKYAMLNKQELCLYVHCITQLRGEITTNGKWETVDETLHSAIHHSRDRWNDEWEMVYMYQYLYHISLEHMHLHAKKKNERNSDKSYPEHACCCINRLHGREWGRRHATHIVLHVTSFTCLLCPVSFLDIENRNIYRVLMIKYDAPMCRKKEKELKIIQACFLRECARGDRETCFNSSHIRYKSTSNGIHACGL